MLPDLPKVGDRTLSALDESYLRYASWCHGRQFKPAPFTVWLRQEQGLNPASAGTGVVFRPRSEQLLWKQAHAQELAARRESALQALGIAG
jgi:hypothetical protein